MDFKAVEDQTKGLYAQFSSIQAEYCKLWADHMLFSWRWWLMTVLAVAPWIIWLCIRKRGSEGRQLYVAMFVMLVASTLDLIGVNLNFWWYSVSVLPVIPGYVTFNLSALPVTTLVFLQFFPRINANVKALVYSILGTFIFQPAMVFLGVYNPVCWKDYYSFPFLYAIYMGAHWLSFRQNFQRINSMM